MFRERWNDPHSVDLHNPVAWLHGPPRADADMRADPLPERPPDPPAAGDATVQVLRTYPAIRPGYPFAPRRRAVGGARRSRRPSDGRGG